MHEAALEGEHGYEIFHRSEKNLHKSENKLIIDVIKEKINNKKHFFSMEVSPKNGICIDFSKFKRDFPLFISIPWMVTLKDGEELDIESIPAYQMANEVNKNELVLLHLNCFRTTEKTVDTVLSTDICNIFTLRGDYVDPKQIYKHASDLVQAFQQRTNKRIGITVSGYPSVHPEAPNMESDLKYLKDKINLGADFIITQLCFSSELIINFIKKCRALGITVPILPGIYIPSCWTTLITLCNLCKIRVPDEMFKKYKSVKENNEKFQEVAYELGKNLVDELINYNGDEKIYGIHFFTLNYMDPVVKLAEKYSVI